MINDDGISSSRVERHIDADIDAPVSDSKPTHKLDNAKSRALLRRVRDWFDQEWERQAHNRYQQAMDVDYYDSLQWAEEDAEALIERGQAPLVYNEIKASIDWMIGTERRTRIDYKVLPRRKEANDDAEIKTKLLKYLSDTNREPMARSQAFADAIKAGVGWLEIGVRGDQTDEPIYYRAQSWRHMLYDSNSVEMDLSDSRYVFRWKHVDLDLALAYFPDRKVTLKRAARDATKQPEDDDVWYMGSRVTEPGHDYASSSTGKYRPYDGSAFAQNNRERVKLTECWYREPVKRTFIRSPHGQEVYAKKPQQEFLISEGVASTFDKVELQVKVAIFCDAGLLYVGDSPYKHDRFPFVPVWAFRRGRDNAPYGPIRAMRDAQDGMNKRMSKALWILSTNQIELEEGAVDDIEDLRDEAARPDAVIVRKRGRELTIHRDNTLADQHLRLMDRDQTMIRAISGVTGENLGRETNADSGKAIIARQEQGGVVTTELFDHLRHAVQVAGEIELSLVEQFFNQEKVVRLVGDRGNAQFVEINKLDDDTGEVLNDITAHQADFYVAQQDYRDTLRQAMFESLFDIVARLAQMSPEIAFKLLDLVVEMADVPNRDELVSRIRELNGMRDPEREPTPEEQAAMQAQAQEQQAQKELMLARAKAEIAELQAKVGKLDAEAIDKRLEAMRSAIESAQAVAISPALMPVADNLIQGAGYVDKAPKAAVGDQREAFEAQNEQKALMAEAQQQAMAEQQAAMQAQQAALQGPGPQAVPQQQQGGMPPLAE